MTNHDFLPFSRPSIGEREIQAVADVLRSGWLTTGPRCRQLEELCCATTGARYAVAMTSATAAMHVALHALGIGPGDEVLTPSMTWVSTINLIVLAGATPVFVDIDRDNLMVTRELLEERITHRTRLMVPVHYAGASLDLDPIRALSDERGIPLLEDAAHAIGTHYKGSPVGGSGSAIFSCHPIKNITSGEGGILVTNDEAFAERCRRLRFHGLGSDTFARETQGRAPQSEVQEPGYKYNLPDINAAIGTVQLARLEDFIERRTALAEAYRERLADFSAVLPLAQPTWPGRHSWHLFIVRVDTERSGVSRAQLMGRLKARGIGTGIHFRAVHEHRYYRERSDSRRGSLPSTEWNSERVVSLPLFPEMETTDVDRVVSAIEDSIAEGC